MKTLYPILILFFALACGELSAQSLDNTGGKIINSGVIRVKNGQVKALNHQDTGRFEFLEKNNRQEIPNIRFYQLVIKNKTDKFISDADTNELGQVLPLIVQDSLIVEDSTSLYTSWVTRRVVTPQAAGPIANRSGIVGDNYLRVVNEKKSQDIQGKGFFTRVDMDNPNGVDVVKGGGFRIGSSLVLSRGVLRNDSLNNFKMENGSTIRRISGASIAYAPIFDSTVNVQYAGGAPMTIGPEIPRDTSVLSSLSVDNLGGITLDRNVTVNKTLQLSENINTEPTQTDKYMLTYHGRTNPEFSSYNAEVVGSFKRTYLPVAQRIFFNNSYTFLEFPSEEALGKTKSMTLRVKRKTFPESPGGTDKVHRLIQMTPLDEYNVPVSTQIFATIGYAWRHSDIDTAVNETRNLSFKDLRLQRYIDNSWEDMKYAVVPAKWDTLYRWAYSTADSVTPFGEFAIGFDDFSRMILATRIFLEGPYRNGNMAADLAAKSLVPSVPPNIYPYNLDPNRNSYYLRNVPDSVVDWVVLEFRTKQIGGDTKYVTGLLLKSGQLMDANMNSPMYLSKRFLTDDEYYIVVRHRNHLSVITENPVRMAANTTITELDFSKPGVLFGHTDAVKPLAKQLDNSIIYGMIAGDVNGDGKIDDTDYLSCWDVLYNPTNKTIDVPSYKSYDMNLSGIINTRDLNFILNNRGRITLVTP